MGALASIESSSESVSFRPGALFLNGGHHAVEGFNQFAELVVHDDRQGKCRCSSGEFIRARVPR